MNIITLTSKIPYHYSQFYVMNHFVIILQLCKLYNCDNHHQSSDMTHHDENSVKYEISYDYHNWYQNIPEHQQSEIIWLHFDSISTIHENDTLSSETIIVIQKQIDDSKLLLPLPWFIRMTSRSPKDTSDCKCNNKNDMLQILLQSSRVVDDIITYFENDEQIGIVIQSWNNKINILDEYRLFIYDQTIVAICPYYSFDDTDNFTGKTRNEIHDTDILNITSYINNISVPYNKCVIDLYYKNIHDIHLIEINPYGKLTDSVCFDWDYDKDILYTVHNTVIRYRSIYKDVYTFSEKYVLDEMR